MNKTVNPKQAGKLFDTLVEELGKADLTEILFNWGEASLDEDMTTIISYPFGRDAAKGIGPKVILKKTDFISWLLSDGPFDTKVYGEAILGNQEWADLIGRARQCIAK